jgi:hypothetical protein
MRRFAPDRIDLAQFEGDDESAGLSAAIFRRTVDPDQGGTAAGGESAAPHRRLFTNGAKAEHEIWVNYFSGAPRPANSSTADFRPDRPK